MHDTWNLNVSPSTCGKVYLAICLLISFIQKGYSLNCVQCVAFDDGPCTKGLMKPTPCSERDTHSKYCHKAIGYEAVGGARLVYRTCSEIPRNNCTNEKYKVKGRSDLTTFKICHYSCATEGCNHASQNYLHMGALLFFSICIAAEKLLLSAL